MTSALGGGREGGPQKHTKGRKVCLYLTVTRGGSEGGGQEVRKFCRRHLGISHSLSISRRDATNGLPFISYHCFQILSSWKYWLTGVASIVLGLFGFLGNFLAIAVLWDAFLGVNCAKAWKEGWVPGANFLNPDVQNCSCFQKLCLSSVYPMLSTECVNSSVARFVRNFLCKFLLQFFSW